MSQHIRTGVLNGVATIEIARPEKKNALTAEMYTAMAQALADAQADGSVRSVLVTGAGSGIGRAAALRCAA